MAAVQPAMSTYPSTDVRSRDHVYIFDSVTARDAPGEAGQNWWQIHWTPSAADARSDIEVTIPVVEMRPDWPSSAIAQTFCSYE